MKMIRKIMAIYKILLMVAIPVGIAKARKTSEREQNNETMSVGLSFRKFIMLLYLKMILNMKTLLYNESYIYYYNIEKRTKINALV